MGNRAVRAWYNISTGMLYKILMLALSFAVRTVFTWTLGLEYLGLNSLFTAVLNVLNLAELGFAGALVVSMYEPFAKHEVGKVNALLRIYKIAYRIIGTIIIVVGVGITPLIPSLISGSYPREIDLSLVYWINLGGVAVGYFAFAYKSCLLTVAQRNDIGNIVHIALMLVQYLVQFIFLFVFKSYYLYIIVLPVINLLYNLITAYIATKMYPEYLCVGKVSKDELKDIKKKIIGLALNKVSYSLCNGLDSIIISMFIGLIALGKYNLYYYIYAAINAILFAAISSVTSTVGNSMALVSADSNRLAFEKIDFVWRWVLVVISACLISTYQPFIELWQGSNALFDDMTMTVFCIYFYVQHCIMPVQLYKDAAGLWWEDRWRVLLEGLFNLAINLLLVRTFGIIGVLLSTILTMLVVSLPWQSQVLFRHYFHTSLGRYVLAQARGFALAIVMCAVTFYLSELLFSSLLLFPAFICKALFSFVFSNVALYCVYKNNPSFLEAKHFVINVINSVGNQHIKTGSSSH
ncbi:lipopolysaccharide biosynthesis protein [Olsenella sp. An285]|uniref:lipopolysaccharide biosynthesis protein n=1 Tax=Olsenella sp. An285 TaxID=1965621 RepID=UPI00117D3EE2|nr:hypothetical protein [Olsenella sp. An285]